MILEGFNATGGNSGETAIIILKMDVPGIHPVISGGILDRP
jgi:hypothetical protein